MVLATSVGVCAAYLVFCADLLDNVFYGTAHTGNGGAAAAAAAAAGGGGGGGGGGAGLGAGWVLLLLPLEALLCSLTDVRSLQATTVLGDVSVAGK